jgi:hypothetical protein
VVSDYWVYHCEYCRLIVLWIVLFSQQFSDRKWSFRLDRVLFWWFFVEASVDLVLCRSISISDGEVFRLNSLLHWQPITGNELGGAHLADPIGRVQPIDEFHNPIDPRFKKK